MNLSSQLIDKLAIGISSLCVAHCLIFPLLVTVVPSFVALGLTSESFHFWMVVSVIPSSIYALALGCKKHEKWLVFSIGALGLSFLLLALVLEGASLGELGEKTVTLTGALLIAFAHVRNFKLCQNQDACHCHSAHDIKND
ncbi:MerC domain-containing protein [Thalassotalea sp. M1531]|uniref:MerC domain-containing protein n=1 Tax=Thalassotalea algicola TaxID=2716224 RepID=A0A7Y0LBM3_9GAMM|nr:MerC domain-containing protein [Thalassotalea algicola]NMP31575.1 MerC domain-containing protein [Thalassotalea algicola]